MKGFGHPQYWLQIIYSSDRPDTWKALRSGSRAKARDRAALALRDEGVDYVLILDGRVQKGAVVEHDDILDEFQAYDVAGARRYELSGKVSA